MIAAIIHWSVRNRFLVLLATLLITGLGLYSLNKTPVEEKSRQLATISGTI